MPKIPSEKETDKLVDHSHSHQNHAIVASEQISKFINRKLKVEIVWAFNQDRSSISVLHIIIVLLSKSFNYPSCASFLLSISRIQYQCSKKIQMIPTDNDIPSLHKYGLTL